MHSVFDGRVAALDFGDTAVALDSEDPVILAVPAGAAAALVPSCGCRPSSRAIVNAHFRIDAPTTCRPITGVINGTVEWLFAFPGRLSVTISGADRLLDTPREELAADDLGGCRQHRGSCAPMPPWQIVRERRATFAASPDQNATGPGARTQWRNLCSGGRLDRDGPPGNN